MKILKEGMLRKMTAFRNATVFRNAIAFRNMGMFARKNNNEQNFEDKAQE